MPALASYAYYPEDDPNYQGPPPVPPPYDPAMDKYGDGIALQYQGMQDAAATAPASVVTGATSYGQGTGAPIEAPPPVPAAPAPVPSTYNTGGLNYQQTYPDQQVGYSGASSPASAVQADPMSYTIVNRYDPRYSGGGYGQTGFANQAPPPVSAAAPYTPAYPSASDVQPSSYASRPYNPSDPNQAISQQALPSQRGTQYPGLAQQDSSISFRPLPPPMGPGPQGASVGWAAPLPYKGSQHTFRPGQPPMRASRSSDNLYPLANLATSGSESSFPPPPFNPSDPSQAITTAFLPPQTQREVGREWAPPSLPTPSPPRTNYDKTKVYSQRHGASLSPSVPQAQTPYQPNAADLFFDRVGSGVSQGLQNMVTHENPEVSKFQQARKSWDRPVTIPAPEQVLRDSLGQLPSKALHNLETVPDRLAPLNVGQGGAVGPTRGQIDARNAQVRGTNPMYLAHQSPRGTETGIWQGTMATPSPKATATGPRALQQQRTPFIPNVDRGTPTEMFQDLLKKNFIDGYGRFTAETIASSQGAIDANGNWTDVALQSGRIPAEKVGTPASWRDMPLSKEGGQPIAATPAATQETSGSQKGSSSSGQKSSSSYGGKSSSYGSRGGYSGGSRVGSSSSSQSSRVRSAGQSQSAESEDWHDHLRDYDGNGRIDSKDIAKAKLMAKQAKQRNLSRGSQRVKGSKFSRSLPSMPPTSPQRQKVLSNLSTAFGKPTGGWPESL